MLAPLESAYDVQIENVAMYYMEDAQVPYLEDAVQMVHQYVAESVDYELFISDYGMPDSDDYPYTDRQIAEMVMEEWEKLNHEELVFQLRHIR
jgi:hypothetical protein